MNDFNPDAVRQVSGEATVSPFDASLQAAAMGGSNADAIRRLISDAVSDPKLRSELYAEPAGVAARYGLNPAQCEALQTLKAALASAVGPGQLGALNDSVVGKLYGPSKPSKPDGGTGDGCAPHNKCSPSGCAPGCNPDATR